MTNPPPPTPVQEAHGGKAFGWIIAYLFFPYGPFLYLAWLRAVPWMLAAVFAIASAAMQIGMVTVLAETNDEPWQPWLVMLLGALFFVIGTLQYLIGRDLWGPTGKKTWRIAGWFFGGLIMVGITLQILLFHLSHAYTT